ncbi:MAG: cation-translocating P-type ATPase [Chloroflexota bacterium]|nr:cation-translocating P-type ATPase [Chloroflexota bacterium]
MSEASWHSIDLREAVERLGSDLTEGLSGGEAQERLKEFGPNTLRGEGGFSIPQLILDQFRDAFIIMLLVATVLSYIVGEATDAILIAVIVLLSAVVGFIQEYRSERAMEAMRKLTAPTARVIRDGQEITVPAEEIVPGDIILLSEGDRVPADARLIESVSLRIDEAPLTGESTPVEKVLGTLDPKTSVADRMNSAFMGTHVVYGRGRAVVTSTGMSTEFGKIAGAVQAIEEEKTPLKEKLDVLGKKLGVFVIALCVVIFGIEVYELGWISEHAFRVGVLLESFMSAIALAVSAVPEALPALVTVTLAIGARALARNNALVRKLASAETLGATTVICADKTGTLTRGEMTVRKLYANGRGVNVTGVGYEAQGDFRLDGKAVNPSEDEHLELLLGIGALCNNASYDEEDKSILGDPTEGALIVSATKAGMEMDALEERYPRVGEIPFSSERKRMTTIHSTPEGEDGNLAYVKGAPELVLARCTHIFEDGRVQELTESRKEEILTVNEQMASDALRVLGMAYRELPDGTQNFNAEDVERDLIFVGLEGMIDPPREEAIEAVGLCRKAGIRNVMITGDHELTAVAIAREIGMLRDGDSGLALTGAQLDELSDEEYEEMVEDVVVYARVSPMHKLKIMNAWKDKGEIVAMTGDGVNDSPALKRADIGVAMGITGTDVSKEASDMVLADDNYATLVRAVEGGRAIYDNIRKYIRFLIASNFDELVLVGGWTLAGFKLPMLPIQILWINLVTDGAPAIALSMDPPAEGIMDRPPRDPRAGIFDGMLGFIILSAFSQLSGSCLSFAYGMFVLDSYDKAITMVFIQAALHELFVIWNCRSETHSLWRLGRHNFNNRLLVVGTLGSIALSLSLMLFPTTREWFSLTPLTRREWLITLAMASPGLWLVLPEWFNRGKGNA